MNFTPKPLPDNQGRQTLANRLQQQQMVHPQQQQALRAAPPLQRSQTILQQPPSNFSVMEPGPPKQHIPDPVEAQAPERNTISEDRSAGSNLEIRNLAALKDRTASQNPSEPTTKFGRTVSVSDMMKPFEPAPYVGEFTTGHAQIQQRFGRLRFDEEHIDEHIDDGEQRILENELFAADLSASHAPLRPQLVTKLKWVEDIEQIDKELGELEMQKQRQGNKQFRILYRIEGTCYFDHPEWTQGYKSIVSRIPVKNLDLFLERNKNVVFIVYRDFSYAPPKTAAKNKLASPKHIRESIHPVSRQLRKTLQMMLKLDWRYESTFTQLYRTREIDAPYLFIYHHRTYWKDMLAQCPPTVREHLNLLAVYVSENYGREYEAADTLFARRKVSAEFVKYLFQPGDILISRSADQYRGLIASSWPERNPVIPARGSRGTTLGYDHVAPYIEQSGSDVESEFASDFGPDIDTSEEEEWESSVEAVEHKEREFTRWHLPRIHLGIIPKQENENSTVSGETSDVEFKIRTWQWSFDGEFKRVEGNTTLRLSHLTANDPARVKEWNMHDLDLYPLRFAPHSMIQTLHRRGRMFWQYRKRGLVSYQEPIPEAQDRTDERFIVDVPTFRKLHPENKSYVIDKSVETMTQAEMEQEKPPDEAFYYLVPLQTKGFNLRTKKWLDLNMDWIGPVDWNAKAFDSLVLDKARKTKELITALVSKQISSSKSTDVIAGKGNGLILLLHGGPGTGKTLTAEGVAELAKKPLYRVTCGDVGTKAEEVENYLESVLHLGKLWDCVVLLDEAEVFLERRSLDDLQRNALVSVFLRVIEYHEGILILTSNRVGTFDEAFRSRIQIAVHYPPLRAYQRLEIWKNFFDRLESFKDGSVDVDDLRDHLEELQSLEINGRQIRNAITTARQYADWKGKPMNYGHLTIALDVAAEFNDYSEKLRGGLTDDQIAEEEGIR
ncbi:hypothetical protein FB567DRAFT_534215 [Paraphoma chrysanthemicola]|uniref:EF-hand domain-containing protein n=1 Tax=Paraphoma chrysanthemicola TaxID=798071 RepID=A0A8K0VUN9_9PLEO|nr:hypothetical protein FB567DRAFT_534215 [Paraphoma chrysanthemicola]